MALRLAQIRIYITLRRFVAPRFRAKIQMMATTSRMVRAVWGFTATLYLTLGSPTSRSKSAEESFTVLSTRMFRARRTK